MSLEFLMSTKQMITSPQMVRLDRIHEACLKMRTVLQGRQMSSWASQCYSSDNPISTPSSRAPSIMRASLKDAS